MNPSLVRSANQFYQALVQHQAFPQMQDLMCKELYGARLLVPVADPQKTTAVPVLTTGKGVRYYPAFTDLVEFGKFDRKHQFGAMEVRFLRSEKISGLREWNRGKSVWICTPSGRREAGSD